MLLQVITYHQRLLLSFESSKEDKGLILLLCKYVQLAACSLLLEGVPQVAICPG